MLTTEGASISLPVLVCVPYARWPTPKDTPCSVRKMPPKAGLPSPLRIMRCLTFASILLSLVSCAQPCSPPGQWRAVVGVSGREYLAVCVCVCVTCAGGGGSEDRDVHLQLKHGVEAKNYDDVSGHHQISYAECHPLSPHPP